MGGMVYQEQNVRLSPGDHLLLVSDGAFEIHDADNRQLGLDGILDILKRLDYPQNPLSMPVLDVTIIEVSFLGQEQIPS